MKLNTIGIKHTTSKDEIKRIRLLNTYCLIWILCSSSFIILDICFKPPKAFEDIIIHTASIIIMGVIIGLNHFNKNTLAKLLLLCVCFINFTLLSYYFKASKFTVLYYALIPVITLSLFKKNIYAIICFVISLLFFNWADIFLKPDFDESLTIRYLILLKDPSAIVLYFSIFLIVFYFKKLNIKNEGLLAEQRDKVLSDKIVLEKQENELRKLNEFKSHFFVNLSHEIRTPITLIKGYTSKIDLNESKTINQEKIDIVNSQIHQIEAILNNILDLSKLDENKLILERNFIEIIPFLNKHYANFAPLFTKKNIYFSIDSDVNNIAVDMDANLVSKSINNLLSNALKFTSTQGEVSINVYYNDNLEIKISDNGLGIPEKDIDKVFERFYQSKNDITKSQGSGIGLSFTKSIVDAHGFTINVNSTPNIETSFIITIPKEYLKFNIDSTNDTVEFSEIIPNKTFDTKKNIKQHLKTILVVDDHEQMRNYVKSVLSNYNVIEAEHGKEALSILKTSPVDLILTDFMMPVMDGEELVSNVKKLGFKIPVIVLTARVDDSAKLNMLRIGVDGYLIKPFIEEELLLFIKNSLKLYNNIINTQNNLSQTERESINQYSDEFHKEIHQLILNNIDNINFGVQDIALHLNISTRTLNRRVKSILGQTAQQIITHTKVEKAREIYLKNPFLTQKEITHKVGMSNTSYLFKKLEENYGQSYKSTV